MSPIEKLASTPLSICLNVTSLNCAGRLGRVHVPHSPARRRQPHDPAFDRVDVRRRGYAGDPGQGWTAGDRSNHRGSAGYRAGRYRMPERDGYEVATFIKEDPALAHIPVVLLTGAFEPVDEDRARQVGCDAVLVKPFEPQVVIKPVHELLGGRRQLSRESPAGARSCLSKTPRRILSRCPPRRRGLPLTTRTGRSSCRHE